MVSTWVVRWFLTTPAQSAARGRFPRESRIGRKLAVLPQLAKCVIVGQVHYVYSTCVQDTTLQNCTFVNLAAEFAAELKHILLEAGTAARREGGHFGGRPRKIMRVIPNSRLSRLPFTESWAAGRRGVKGVLE